MLRFDYFFLFLSLLSYKTISVCESIPLEFGEKSELSTSQPYDLDIEYKLIYNGPQPSNNNINNLPSGCSGSIMASTLLGLSSATFTLNCDRNDCTPNYRTLTTRNIEDIKYVFPESDGYTKRYSYQTINDPVVINSTCKGVDYQPDVIGFQISDLVYNYTIDVINKNEYRVTRIFDHLGSANITINGTLMASLSADNTLSPNEDVITCQSGKLCMMKTNKLTNSPYIGNDYLRFYYNVPAFVFLFSSVPDPITDVCGFGYAFLNEESEICNKGPNKLGPCISFGVTSSITTDSASSTSICDSDGSISPTPAPSSAMSIHYFISQIAMMFVFVNAIILLA